MGFGGWYGAKSITSAETSDNPNFRGSLDFFLHFATVRVGTNFYISITKNLVKQRKHTFRS